MSPKRSNVFEEMRRARHQDAVGGILVQIRNRVVARRQDGRMVKGYTFDFMPNKEMFHVVAPDDDKKVTEVAVSGLKAVYYVKTFEGDCNRTKSPGRAAQSVMKEIPGVKLKVTFRDGEVLYGTTTGYSPGRRGFFVTPADPTSNNERAYILAESTTSVETWR